MELNWSEIVKKLVNAEIAATDSDLNFVLLNADVDTLSAELVYTLTVPHKHHLKLVAVGVVVDELGNLLVYWVILERNVDRYACLKINYVTLEGGRLKL